MLDQRRLLIALDHPRRGRSKLLWRVDQRGRLATLAGALGQRLDEGREVGPVRDLARASMRDRERRRLHPGIAHQPLGHPLVEGGGGGERVGEHIRLVEQLAQRRDLRLARAALEPFGDREHEVEALARDEARGERLAAADTDRLAAKRFERRSERIDRADAVELGNLLLGVAKRAIFVAEIVDQGDAHHRGPASSVRSPPTTPSGSV